MPALLVAACGDPGSGPDPASVGQTATHAVSAQEREAARMLSLTSAGPSGSTGGYANAVNCAASLGSLLAALQGSEAVDAAQLDALKRAERLFAARSSELASGGQKATADIARARAEIGTADMKVSRSALGCIQQLASQS